jgi:nuclear GTP-binding protein
MEGNQVGDAKILNTLSEAFTIEGLLDEVDDGAAWQDEEAAGEEAMAEE